MKRLIFLIILNFNFTLAQDFLMQGWYWDYPKTTDGYNWADTLTNKANELANAGFTYIWLPPLSRASFGNSSNGYDPKDLYDLGEYGGGATGFGTRQDINELVAEFANVGINAVADVVYNHRDGGKAENNDAVENYIENYVWTKADSGYNPYPYDRWRSFILLGGTSGNDAGDYYFKVSSASGHNRFNGFKYNIYMETKTVKWQNQTDISEHEPNGGGDCSQDFNDITLGVNMNAFVDDPATCRTDEFHLNLKSTDFNSAGDTLFIYFGRRNSDYSDLRVYGIWSGPRSMDIADEIIYQTYTDFTNLPSSKGLMNYENFKPNNTNITKLDGDWDWPWFFYDYDQNVKSTRDVLYNWTRWLWEDVGIRGFRMDAVKHFPPNFVGDLFDSLYIHGIYSKLNVGEFFDANPITLNQWITDVYSSMETSTITELNPRIYDFALRQSLKDASDTYGYDVRNVFNSGIVDGAAGSGFNVVTFLNNHDFRETGQEVVNDPILGYAYLLTNNKVGLPSVFYPDYYYVTGFDKGGLKNKIDELIAVHKKHIFGATEIDYLSRFSTPYTQTFSTGFSNTTLFYQIMGTSSGRDLLVAINYAGGTDTLNVIHGINMTSVNNGDVFVDLLNYSLEPLTYVNEGKVNIKLPPRSYSVWVKGVTVQAKIFLQGAYDSLSNNMTTNLRNNDLLPFVSPYLEDQRTVKNIHESIVDWILVELYDNFANEPIVSKSVFVRNDGMLVLEDGVTTTIPLDAAVGDYYLVLKHRNHLAVASANKIMVNASTPLYDFTTDN